MEQNSKPLGKSLIICILICFGLLLTDAGFLAGSFQLAIQNGEYANLANFIFYIAGFVSLILYGLIFYKKKTPAFYRGLLIFTVAFFAMMIGTRTNLLSTNVVEYTGIVNVKRLLRVVQVMGLFVDAVIAILVGTVASRLSLKARNRALLNIAAVLACVFAFISAGLNLFFADNISSMNFSDICIALVDWVPALYITSMAIAFVLGSEARHGSAKPIAEA